MAGYRGEGAAPESPIVSDARGGLLPSEQFAFEGLPRLDEVTMH